MNLHRAIPVLMLSVALASNIVAQAQEVTARFSQGPTSKIGGCLAVAQPMKLTGGWNHIYRAADDFKLSKATDIGGVVWWGCSCDGRHGEDDGLDQVLGFALEFYEDDLKTNRPGRLLHRSIIALDETALERTKYHSFGGSDVMRFKARLPEAFHAQAKKRYWFSVSAYLSGEPMWVWFQGESSNSNNAFDHGVNGVWGDQPEGFGSIDLAFELYDTLDLKTASGTDASFPKTDQETIEKLVKQLGADSYSKRDAAQEQLAQIGTAATPSLLPHAKHDDVEIRYRVRSLLTLFGHLDALKPMTVHNFRQQDSLATLAENYDTTADELIRANALGKQTPSEGMMLLIP